MARVIYENELSSGEDIKGFILKGRGKTSFPKGSLKLECVTDEKEEGSECVLWCPISFPSDIRIEWEFRPIKGPGKAAVYFAVKESSDSCYNLSYFCRSDDLEKSFHLCNFRKGIDTEPLIFGADPMPEASKDSSWYRMCIIKKSGEIAFYINELKILEYEDDGFGNGDILTSGSIGFLQEEELCAEYRNLKVTWI